MKFRLRSFALTVVASAAVLGPIGPATAADSAVEVGSVEDGSTKDIVIEHVRVQDVGTGMCLDSDADGDVYTLTCNSGDYQVWRRAENGQLVNKATGRCLRVQYGLQTTSGCEDLPDQKWEQYSGAGEYFHALQFFHRETGQCLDSNAAGEVYVFDCNGGPYQHWTLWTRQPS